MGEGVMDRNRRERIAARVLQGLVSSLTIDRDRHMRLMCNTAVKYADMLLAFLDDDLHDPYDDDEDTYNKGEKNE